MRFASEDIGNADPRALSIAMAAKDAVHFMGMPEGNTALAQAAIYMAVAAKSNAVYRAYLEAAEAAANEVAEPVPLHLRNAPTTLMKDLDYGKGYRYAHDEAGRRRDRDGVPAAGACRPAILRAGGARNGNRNQTEAGLDPEETGRAATVVAATPPVVNHRPETRILAAHLAQHLGAQRQDEREAIVALHPSDRDPDEIAFAVQHAAAGNAGMTIGEAGDQVVGRALADVAGREDDALRIVVAEPEDRIGEVERVGEVQVERGQIDRLLRP